MSGFPLWYTLRRQHLTRRAPARALHRVVRDLVGVQAQYESAAALALHARLEGFSAAQFAAALYRDRTLVKMWSLRGTLHVVTPEDWRLFVAIYGPWYHRDWSFRAYGLDGRELDEWIYPAMLEALADGPLTYKQILAALQQTIGHRHPNLAGYFNSWGGIVRGLCFQGKAVLIDSTGAETRVSRSDRWFAPEGRVPYPGSRLDAVVELLRRYLHTYGPAAPTDFQYWTLLEQPIMRAAWARLEPELAAWPGGARPLYLLRADARALSRKPPAPPPPLRLIPKFDMLTLMHKDKGRIVDPPHAKSVFRIAGQIEAALLWRGRLAGTWRYARKANTLAVQVWPFAPLPRAALAGLEAEAAHLADFWGLPSIALTLH